MGREGLEVVEHPNLTAAPLTQGRRHVGPIEGPGHVAGQAAGEPFAGDHLNFIPKRQLQQRQDPVPVLVMTRQGLGFQQGIGGALAHQEAGLAVVLRAACTVVPRGCQIARLASIERLAVSLRPWASTPVIDTGNR